MAWAIATDELTNKGKWKGQRAQDGIGSSEEGEKPSPGTFLI